MSLASIAAEKPRQEEQVVTKAVVNAADRLGISAKRLSLILGLSEATVSRMRRQDYSLARDSKSFELAILLIRLFRSLDAIVGGDEAVARQWLLADNRALDAAPIDRIASISGLTDVLAYLDARRALV